MINTILMLEIENLTKDTLKYIMENCDYLINDRFTTFYFMS